MSYIWSPQEEHLLRILRPTNTYQEISNEFQRRVDRNLPGFRCERSDEAIRKKCDRDDITPESCEDYEQDSPYERRFKKIKEIQDIYREESEFRTRGVIGIENITRKILALSDIHFPLAREDLLKAAVDEHSDADICMLNGDLLDGYIYSTFAKHRSIAALHEYNTTFEFVALCASIFKNVVITMGNHDVRIAKAVARAGFDKDASQVFRPNLLARIANGERLDESGLLVEKLDFSNVHYQMREDWYVRIGKTIFAHPWNKGSSKPLWTAEKCLKYFETRYDPDMFDSIVIGHTHKLGKAVVNSKLLIEQGCFADLMLYAHEPRMYYTNGGSVNGYAVIYQDKDGNTDFNLSGPVFLGEALPPKKEIVL